MISKTHDLCVVSHGGRGVGEITKSEEYRNHHAETNPPVRSPWMWFFIIPHHEGRKPTNSYAATRGAAMAAFAKSWQRE